MYNKYCFATIFLAILFIFPLGKAMINKEDVISSGIAVFLNGTACSGKTSISQALCKQWRAKNKLVKIIEWDQVALDVIKDSNIDLDIKLPKAILFKKYVDQFGYEKLNKLLEQINITIAKRTNEFLVSNDGIVIIDTVFDNQKAIEDARTWFSKNTQVFNVLIYCQISTLLEYVIKRNKVNIPTEKRDILYVLKQFMNMYKPQFHSTNLILDSMYANEFDNFYLKAKDQGQNTGINCKEIINTFDKTCKTFKNNFGLFKNRHGSN